MVSPGRRQPANAAARPATTVRSTERPCQPGGATSRVSGPMTSHAEVGLGVIGCGGFGLFALQHFTQIEGVKLVGMAGTQRPAALAAAARFGVENVDDVGELLRRDDVGVVYIATPPFLHHPQAMAALEAGK